MAVGRSGRVMVESEDLHRAGLKVTQPRLRILYGDCERPDCPHRPLRPGKTPPR